MGIVCSVTKFTLSLFGFSSLGPVANSLAAAYQSAYGPVVAGSLFAKLQSLAMAGTTLNPCLTGLVALIFGCF